MDCPMTRKECSTECAWFKQSRRRYQDGRYNGECLLMAMTHSLKEINNNIKTLEHTIYDKKFID